MTDEECRAMAYGLAVLQNADLDGDWRGWKLRGRWLVAPCKSRISAARLAGLLWTEQPRHALGKEPVLQDGVARFRADCQRRLSAAGR